MKSKKAAQKLGAGAILLIVAIGAIMFTEPGQDFLSSVTPEAQEDEIKITSDIVDTGSAATLVLNAYDAEANSRTEAYPAYLITKGDNTIVDCAGSNTTSSVNIGDTVKIYGCSEDDAYIVEPKTYTVTVAGDQVDLVAHKLITGSNLAITVYDDTGATALSVLRGVAGNNNTADYAGGSIGADEFVTYFVKIKNEEANSAYDFYGWCGYWMNDVDDVIVKSITSSTISGAIGHSFTKVSEPEELDDITVSIDNAAGTASTGNYKTCWVLDEPITLHEWDSITTKVIAEAGSTGPSADTGDNFGLVAVDWGWNKDKNGAPVEDFFQHDDDEKISDIGLVELELNATYGLEYKVSIEMQ